MPLWDIYFMKTRLGSLTATSVYGEVLTEVLALPAVSSAMATAPRFNIMMAVITATREKRLMAPNLIIIISPKHFKNHAGRVDPAASLNPNQCFNKLR